jgi:hypothetical protein
LAASVGLAAAAVGLAASVGLGAVVGAAGAVVAAGCDAGPHALTTNARAAAMRIRIIPL